MSLQERLTESLRRHWPIYDPSKPNKYRGGPFDMDAVQLAAVIVAEIAPDEANGLGAICRCQHEARLHRQHGQWEGTCSRCSCLIFEDRPADDQRVLVLRRDARGRFLRPQP